MKNLTGFVTNANYQLLVDLYELNMAQAYLNEGMDKPAIFDLGIRGPIKNRGYLIACGIGEAAALVKNISFSPESIEYLKGLKKFTDNFLGFLEKFRFEGDIYGVRDGEVVFPGEPLVKVKSSLAQGQLVETILLNTIGFQTLVATKASRVCQGAAAAGVIDFGLRRAQGGEAGLKASKAAYVGGCIGTSNLLAGSNYGIPVFGTVAHSYIMAHGSEEDAFAKWCMSNDNSTLLIDTYGTIKGAENAIRIADEMHKSGRTVFGVRIDSKQQAKESSQVRKILDAAGWKKMKIIASGGLDEYKIEKFWASGGVADYFGVGTSMVVSSDLPALDINYKLAQVEGRPAIKKTSGKKSMPGDKQVYRICREGKFGMDIVCIEGEKVSDFAREGLEGAEEILIPIFKNGKLECFGLEQARAYAAQRISMLPDEYRRLEKPPVYKVSISEGLKRLAGIRTF